MNVLDTLPAAIPSPVTPAALPVAPTPEDTLRFEAALVPPRDLQGLEAVKPPVEPAIATPGTLGERILTSVDQMRVNYKAGMERMDLATRKDEVRMPDVMRVMVDAMQMSLQQDMLSKLVGRTTQNIDTLLKGQ